MCSTVPRALHRQPSSKHAESSDAAGSRWHAVSSTLPSAWSSPTPKGRQKEQETNKTQGMSQCSRWESMEEISWAKGRSPALKAYEHHVPAPWHSCISTAPPAASCHDLHPVLATEASQTSRPPSCSTTCGWRRQLPAPSSRRSTGTGTPLFWLTALPLPAAPHGIGAGHQAPRAGLACHKAAQLPSTHGGAALLRPHTNTVHSLERFWIRITPLQ